MSLPTPATAAFLARWLPGHSRPNLLVRVVLAVPSALSLYFTLDPAAMRSTALATPPGGHPWQPVILDTDPVHDPGEFLAAGPVLATFGFTIANTRLLSQASGTASDLMSTYEWKGAAVTAWLWEAGLESLSDALPIFSGGIVQGKPKVTRDLVQIRCIKRKDWRRRLPSREINRTDYANAPETSIGAPLPAIYGMFSPEGFEEPWTASYPIVPISARQALDDVGAAGLVVPGVMVDSGVGGADARILFAEHALESLGGTPSGHDLFIAAGDRLARMGTPGGDVLGDKSGFDLADEQNTARIGVPCIDVRTTGSFPNLAVNPRAAMEIFDPSSYARISSDGSKGRLTLVVGNPGQPGKMVSAELVIGYRCSHTSTTAAFRYNRPANPGGGLPSYSALVAHTTAPVGQPVIERQNVGIYDPIANDPPNIPAGAVTTDWNTSAGDIECAMTGVQAGHYFDVFFVALVILYQPSLSLVTPEQFTDPGGNFWSRFRRLRDLQRQQGGQVAARGGVLGLVTNPAVYEHAGTFFANLQGREDTTGDYTGVASEVIERPVDILRHALTVYGGESAGDIESDIDAFGSFTRARPVQNTIEGGPVTLGAHLGETQNLAAVIERIASQAPGLCYLSRFDDKWKYVPWLRRPAIASFPRRIEAEDVVTLEVEDPAEVWVQHDVRVDYAFDYFRRRFAHRCTVGPDRSDGGWSSRGRRDQLLRVYDSGAAQNNRLDLTRSAVAYTPALTAGTYTPLQMMVEVKARLVALGISGAVWNVAWGTAIVAAHNDRLDLTMNAATHALTLTAGEWTLSEIGPVVEDAIRAADSGATAPRCGVGLLILEGFNDQLDFSDGTAKKVTVPPGYYRDGAQLAAALALALNSQSSNWTASYNGGTQKFTIGRSSGTCQLLCSTGPNATKSVYPALGFSHAANRTGASSYVADYARNRGRFHVQTKANIALLRLTGANRANGAWSALGFDYAADGAAALNHEGTWALQDETFAITEATAFALNWVSGANAALTCADVLGYRPAADDAAATRQRADRRRGGRELLADESRDWFGEKEPVTISATDVRSSDVALHLRDTIFDLRHQPPLRLKLRTHRLPDLELGRLVETGDLSSIVGLPPRYGAGAWSGKLWWAVEVAQLTGREWHQEVVLVEAQRPLFGATAVGPDGVTGVPGPPTGTAIVIFADNRDGGTWHLYGVRIATDGTLPWTADGIAFTAGGAQNIATQTDQRNAAKLIVDGTGESILVWRSGASRIRAQKINSSGAVQWAAGGVQVGSGTVNDGRPVICSDASGGAYIAWDTVEVTAKTRIVRIDSAGAVVAGWSAGGKLVSVAAGAQTLPRICPDGAGGVIVAWIDARGATTDAYLQRYDAAGNALWAANGVGFDSGSQQDTAADVIPDGSGGAFVVWESSINIGINAHHISAAGVKDPLWPSTGRVICNASNAQLLPVIVSDAAGGFIAAWQDERTGGSPRVFAQRVNAAGAVQWTANGVDVMRGRSGGADPVAMIADGSGGAFIVSSADTTGTIRAQRITSAGVRAAGWTDAEGLTLANAANSRRQVRLASDGVDGFVAVWEDARNVGNSSDIYAQRVTGAGAQLWTANGHPIVQRTADQRMPWIGTV